MTLLRALEKTQLGALQPRPTGKAQDGKEKKTGEGTKKQLAPGPLEHITLGTHRIIQNPECRHQPAHDNLYNNILDTPVEIHPPLGHPDAAQHREGREPHPRNLEKRD